MELLALSAAAVALLLSLVALLLAFGVTLRMLRLERSQTPPPREGLSPGSETPQEFVANLPTGLDPSAWLEGPSLVVFGAGNCEPCRELVTALGATDLTRFEGRVAFVERPDSAAPLSSSAPIDAQFIIDRDGMLAAAFDTNVTPHTFVIQRRQIVGQKIGADVDEILPPAPGETE